uniref:Telomere repeat binding bouquet formation protein 2 n=1 Tax=Cyclopterus lumpus TaxID=8103 RepID=A0A8C2XEC3_CYCLU
MFRDTSAWFSSSVPQACHTFWISEGGTIADWRTAAFLFSEDATCADTLRIFESKDYLWKKVAVFHSLFLSACEKRQSVMSVCIGHYVLPPTSVQEGEICNTLFSVHFFCTGYVSIDNLQKYSGDVYDFHPGCFRCSNCKAHCCPLLHI